MQALKFVLTSLSVILLVVLGASFYYYSFETEQVPLGECARPPIAWPVGCFQESQDTETCLSVQPHSNGCKYLEYSGWLGALTILVASFTLVYQRYTRQGE